MIILGEQSIAFLALESRISLNHCPFLMFIPTKQANAANVAQIKLTKIKLLHEFLIRVSIIVPSLIFFVPYLAKLF